MSIFVLQVISYVKMCKLLFQSVTKIEKKLWTWFEGKVQENSVYMLLDFIIYIIYNFCTTIH